MWYVTPSGFNGARLYRTYIISSLRDWGWVLLIGCRGGSRHLPGRLVLIFDTQPSEMIALLGIPLDKNSSFLTGAAEAPAKIREAFRSDSANSFTESGIDLKD